MWTPNTRKNASPSAPLAWYILNVFLKKTQVLFSTLRQDLFSKSLTSILTERSTHLLHILICAVSKQNSKQSLKCEDERPKISHVPWKEESPHKGVAQYSEHEMDESAA